MATKQNMVAVVDIGSTKIIALAGTRTENNKINVLACSKVASRGIKRGVVLNIEETITVLNEAINAIEDQLDTEISEINVAIAGHLLKTIEYKGYRYTSADGIVTQEDINELYEEVINRQSANGDRVYHVIPQEYIIDDEPGISSPVGCAANKIDAVYHLLSAPESYQKNVEIALNKINIDLGKVMFSPLVTSEAVLTDDEKEAGVVLVDIGGGITKTAIYFEGVLCHCSVVPFGGNVITKDIKEGCSILYRWAEQLKVKYGKAMGDFAEAEKVVTIPAYNGWEPKEISFKSLAFIIQARLEEIIDSFYYQIENSGYLDKLGAGIVLTGGTSKLSNIDQLVRYRTGMDARIGFPVIGIESNFKELNQPEYYTALGLLKVSLNNRDYSTESKEKTRKKKEKETEKKSTGGFFRARIEKMSQQITMIFDEDDLELN